MLESEYHMSCWSQPTLADTRYVMGAWVSFASLSLHFVVISLVRGLVLVCSLCFGVFLLVAAIRALARTGIPTQALLFKNPWRIANRSSLFPSSMCSSSILPRLVVNLALSSFRLGLLGFATNPKIRDDNKLAGEEGTGNYGMLHGRGYHFSKLTRS